MPDIICRICKRPDFEDWGELADHILKDHKKNTRNKAITASRKWASNYKYKHVLYKEISKKETARTALTEEQKQTKADCRMELSGRQKLTITVCPMCKSMKQIPIEIEHYDNPLAWKIQDRFVVMCQGCGK